MTIALNIFRVLVMAIGFRIRGDAKFMVWTGRGATTARIVAWATPIGLTAWHLYGGLWYVGIFMGVAAWLGAIAPWWDSIDMGRMEGRWIKDFALQTVRGIIWTAPMAAVAFLSAGSPWPLLVAGALCGVVYEIGWRFKARQTEIAEAIFGGVLGVALVASAPW